MYDDYDESKSVVAGGLTGLLFKSTAGWRKCGKGGLIGLGLSSFWAFGLKRQEAVQNFI